MQMPFTGERYVPELRGQIYYEHLHRYAVALEMARGADVLDIASGEGYGAAYLSTVARSVVGVDIDAHAVRHAAARYTAMNLSFRVGSCTSLPIPDQSVDLVVSFETLEHVDGHEQFMREVVRVLRPDGRFIVSSPNRLVYSDDGNYTNPFHVRELYFDEFRDLLQNWFPRYRIYGQRIFAASAMHPLRGTSETTRCVGPGRSAGEQGIPALGSPSYFIGVCSRAETRGDTDDVQSIFLDPQDDLLQHILHPVPLLPPEPDEQQLALPSEPEPIAFAEPDQLALTGDVAAAHDEQIDSLLRTIYGDDATVPPRPEAFSGAEERVRQSFFAAEEALAALARSEEERTGDRRFLVELLRRFGAGTDIAAGAPLAAVQESLVGEAMRVIGERDALADDVVRLREHQVHVERQLHEVQRQAAAEHLQARALEGQLAELRAVLEAATSEREQLQRQLAEMQSASAGHAARADELGRRLAQTEAVLTDVLGSTSWQMTKPMRVAVGALRGRRPGA